MSAARDHALTLRTIYGVEGVIDDRVLDEMLADRSIPVVMTTADRLNPLWEVYASRVCHLRRTDRPEWHRWGKGESLGHDGLHVGDQTLMPLQRVALQERQACEFTGTLIFGDPAETFGWPPFAVTVPMVARAARVPEECVGEWWRIVSSELGYTEPYRRARESAWWRTPAQWMAWGR